MKKQTNISNSQNKSNSETPNKKQNYSDISIKDQLAEMENKKITIIDIKEVNEKFVKDYLKDTKDQLKNNKVYIKMNSDNNGESNEVYTRLIEAEKLIIIREINQILNEYDKLTADLKFYEDKLKELEDGHKTNN